MPDKNPDVRLSIEHSIKTLSRWTLALYLAVAVFLGGGILANRALSRSVETEATKTHMALCTFVADLQQRVDNTVEFLKKHPTGQPIPGIPRATFQTTLRNQRSTLRSLDGLGCDV